MFSDNSMNSVKLLLILKLLPVNPDFYLFKTNFASLNEGWTRLFSKPNLLCESRTMLG